MDRRLRIAALVSGVFVFVVFLGFGYFESVFVSPRGNEVIVVESALLPEGWNTYRADEWSVGYPDDYTVKKRSADAAVYFVPDDAMEKKTYFLVQQEAQSLTAIQIEREAEGYPEPVDVTIVNYPGVKYTLGSGRVEFYIDHGSSVFLLASDDPENIDIAAMFVTFAFTE